LDERFKYSSLKKVYKASNVKVNYFDATCLRFRDKEKNAKVYSKIITLIYYGYKF